MSLCDYHLLRPAANREHRHAAQQHATQEKTREKDDCLPQSVFVFFGIRRGTFTCSGGDDASATKRNVNHT